MRKPIRIAQVLNRMDSGGIEAIVIDYYRHLDHQKIQFDFYYAEGSSLPQREELERLGAGLYPIPGYSKPVKFHRALYHAFCSRQYPIVHVHLSTMSVFALFAAWRAGIPVRICHNHSTAHWSEGIVTLLKYMLRPWNAVFANRFFACGAVAGEWMYGRRRMQRGDVTVIRNAIDTQHFAYDDQARMQLRDELGIGQDAFVIGHVGRFRHQKNHRFLLHIFAEVLKKKENAVLLLIGDGEKMGEIRMLAEELKISDRIVFAGVRSDVGKLYSAMDVFCLPSYYEGMPLVAWEAQSNGLPCLFADTITKEASVKDNAKFLSLEQAEKWAAEMVQMRRDESAVCDSIDIRRCSEALASMYLAQAADASNGDHTE